MKPLLVLLSLFALTPLAAAAPRVELAPPDQPQPGIPRPRALQLPREDQVEVPLDQAAMTGTAIGGYGEVTFNAPSNAPAVVDLRRLVLYVGHNFTQRLRFYGEIEAEHAIASSGAKGEFEIEQAFLDYLAWHPFNLRAGVILMPVGIINIYHEPPTFNGVDRPLTDTLIIPTTWREPGIGFFGGWRSLRWQIYAVNGFDASHFTDNFGVYGGAQEGSLALGHDWGVVARLDWQPLLGTDVGASYYFANSGQGRAQYGDVPVQLVEADGRARFFGFEARAEAAAVFIGGTERLNAALQSQAMGLRTLGLRDADDIIVTPGRVSGPVASTLFGGYVEIGYNVLHRLRLRSGMQLMPFFRYEHVDTQLSVVTGFARAPGDERNLLTAGLTFRPIAEVALKVDYQREYTDATVPADATVNHYNAGIGFMF